MHGSTRSHQILWRGRFVSCVLRTIIQMPAAPGLEHSRTQKIPRQSNAMTHSGSRESRIGEARQGGQGMTHLYTRAGRTSCQYQTLLPLLLNLAKTVSLQPDASDFPTPGLLGPLQGFPLSSEVRSMGVVPVPGGHQWTTSIGCLRPRHRL